MRDQLRVLRALLISVAVAVVAGAARGQSGGGAERARGGVAATGPSVTRYRIFDGDRVGFMDGEGREVIPCTYTATSEFREGCATVEENGARALIDLDGRVLIRRKADLLCYVGHGVCAVVDGGLRLVPLYGGGAEVRLPYDFCMGYFEEGRLAVRRKGRWGFIDVAGKEVVAPRFLGVTWYSEGLAAASDERGWGYIDHAGKWAIAPSFKTAGIFSNGLAYVGDERGRRRYINHAGQFAFGEKSFQDAFQFHEGLALVRGREKLLYGFGYIGVDGEFAVQPNYADAHIFSEGLAGVKTEEKGFVYVDQTGAEVLRCEKAVTAGAFRNGLAFVEEPERSGYVDRTGRWVWSRAHARGDYKNLGTIMP